MESQNDLRYYAVIGVVAFCVFANTLGHGFVYDDNRQILMNPLIQRSELYGTALTSDVWAFKGGGDLVASNYYRPTFVGWMIVNWALFGASPAGWHLTNVLLHVGVCLLLFVFLRKLDVEPFVSLAISLVFAVHPAHVENVAWIAGATDPLLAFFLLLSLILALMSVGEDSSKQRRALYLSLSVAAYILALGSKEIALFCVPLFWIIFRRANGTGSLLDRDAIVRSMPFLVAAVGFFAIRAWVLNAVFLPVEDPIPEGSALLTIPKLFAFYLRQIFFPVWLGPSLPVRPVEVVDVINVLLPVVVSVAATAAFILLARRSFVQALGLALFGLTLLPVLNPASFGTEQMAHDRYLYLPVAGVLLLVIPELVRLVGVDKISSRRNLFIGILGVLVVVLGTLTFSYNTAWKNGEKLWRHAVTVDPRSAHAWYNLASMTTDPRESLNSYERSLEIRRTPSGLVGKARSLIGLGDNEAAVTASREVIAIDPKEINAYTLFQAYEVESFALAGLGRNQEAEESLRAARNRLPIYSAALTAKIAVVLYNQNRKKEALEELEKARQQARTEYLAESKQVLLRLGMLHSEFGNRDAARNALREYLAQTEGMVAVPASDRQQAAALLARL